jgi:His-Xaa-Ser system radical SAM maturase HxsC
MIELRLRADFETSGPPFVVRLRVGQDGATEAAAEEAVALARPGEPGAYECRSRHGRFVFQVSPYEPVDGDVVLCVPSRGALNRLFRRSSPHNTLLLTERCDQLCVMCSQPPKNTHDEWRFPLYEKALLLVEKKTVVGISGGEPTLYKDALLGIIDRVWVKRPDICYHILSNGQHFASNDEAVLRRLHARGNILWGIPLYSHHESTHDEIVGKDGAFSRLLNNLFFLAGTGARIELRTVITSRNVFDLPFLADFIAKHTPFISVWAIMAMESIGYALPNWRQLFFDHSLFPQPIVNALEISSLRDIDCRLYNVPRCTIPAPYRRYCADSISDWKKKYLPTCETCRERKTCTGFFEWYNPTVAWAGISPIES